MAGGDGGETRAAPTEISTHGSAIMKRRNYGYGDGPPTPWVDPENWPCLSDSHFPEVKTQIIADDGEIELYIMKCEICSLMVQYYDDYDLCAHGYNVANGTFDDLESARRTFQLKIRLMLTAVEPSWDIADLCQRAGVVRLDLFGVMESMLAGPDGDLNILARFDDRADNLFSRYFDLKEGLERILENSGRGVALVEERAVKNPYRKEAINSDRMMIYEA